MQSLQDSIKNNPIHLRVCIQYEVLQKKNLFDSYKSFCGTFGDDAMEYQEFELWYYRFYHGETDLEYDWDRERVQRKQLYDLPMDVFKVILDELDEKSKIATRQVSTEIRDLIHPVKPATTTSIVVRGTFDSINVTFNGNLHGFSLDNGDDIEWMPRQQIVERAVKKFKNLLRTRLDSEFIDLDLDFSIISDWNEWFLAGIRNVPYPIKNLKVHTGKRQFIINFLKSLSTAPLEKIELASYESSYFVEDDFLDMEIIRSAKSLILPWFGLFLPSDLRGFYQFGEFRCRLNFVSMDALVKLRENCRTSPSFKKCAIRYDERYNTNEIETALGMKIDGEECKIREEIPDSDDILEWFFDENSGTICIEKMSKV